jgi:crossover junction endodeoxyribonuclease RuvC
MIILGIDPGTASTGYGLIEVKKSCQVTSVDQLKNKVKCLEYGLIKTEPDSPTGDRLKKLHDELSKLIKNFRPEILVIESLFFFKNFKTAIPVSQASGVVFFTAAKNKLPAFSLTPLQVKMTIAGHGHAEKEKVQEKIKDILNLKEIPKPDDAADALAIAVTFFLKNNLLTRQFDSAKDLGKS